jgi:hypothetical protein
MSGAVGFPSAFAVWFKHLSRWDPSSFHRITWHWPSRLMAPIGSVLRLRKERVNKSVVAFSDLQPITIHFDGSVEKRVVDPQREYSMELWFAQPGDIVIAKIDLKNGAAGIVPADWKNVVVTNHFAVYEPDRSKLVPEYLHLIIQATFFKAHLWRNKVGAEGRKEVKLDFFEQEPIPVPSLSEQNAIVARWREAEALAEQARSDLSAASNSLDATLHGITDFQSLETPMLALFWSNLEQWAVKSARAAAFRLANPTFSPLSTYAEEATEMVRPWHEPEKEWPVYGVNNKDGVFFSHLQKGHEFNAPYKRIRKDWFFHNPTRSSVGSLGIVPEVPDDAITSPEYQVWRLRPGSEWEPEFVAALVRTTWFVKLIQVHRVGAVKQRLYVENLLAMPMPAVPPAVRNGAAKRRAAALLNLAHARRTAEKAKDEVEALILGTKKVSEL